MLRAGEPMSLIDRLYQYTDHTATRSPHPHMLPQMYLSVELSASGKDTAVVTLIGELDMATVPLLDAVLDPLPDKGFHRVILLAARLSFCDLSGLRAICRIHGAMAANGGG